MSAFNRDRMVNAPSKDIASGAMLLANHLQGLPKEHQPLIVAALFKIITEEYRIDGPDVMTMAANVTATTLFKPNVAFEGLRLYVRNELLGG
ncbi:hypothetical protein [Inquilinus limosus]|uniref:hypothetical protein n=1 Tax=Inquilinus limosus TaxID=171674 RepID=UPI00047A6C8B|nr:hypothetical protein [Inquilinus limosus]